MTGCSCRRYELERVVSGLEARKTVIVFLWGCFMGSCKKYRYYFDEIRPQYASNDLDRTAFCLTVSIGKVLMPVTNCHTQWWVEKTCSHCLLDLSQRTRDSLSLKTFMVLVEVVVWRIKQELEKEGKMLHFTPGQLLCKAGLSVPQS